MSLTQISAGTLLFGLAVLGGAVFLLQRLRVRRDERIVPTTLFWLAAQKESQARKLTERFRSPWVFALLFAIVSLFWIAFAGPKQASQSRTSTIVFVDDSAAMQRKAAGGGTRLEAAFLEAEKLLAKLPRSQRSLVLAGPTTLTLLGPGEPLELLKARLALAPPPSGSFAALREALGTLFDARSAPNSASDATMPLSNRVWKPGTDATMVAIGAPASLAALEALGTDEHVSLKTIRIEATEAANEGILAFGAAPAASGHAGEADLYIETTGATPRLTVAPPGPSDEANGAPHAAPGTVELETPAPGQFFARGLPLDGGLATARLDVASDALAADNQASLRLPDRGPVLVHLAADLPPTWRAALEASITADSGLALANEALADVTIQVGTQESSLPALRLTAQEPTAAQAGTLRTARPAGTPAFAPLFDALALGELGTGLRPPGGPSATPSAPPSQLLLVESATTGPSILDLPARLIAPPYELAETRTFPLFVGTAIRWLAGRTGPEVDLRNLTSRDLVGRTVSLETPGQPPVPLELAATPRPPEFWPALVLLAACLLAFEWYLTSTRRIP